MQLAAPRVDVVLPCRDEAAALAGVLARVPAGYGALVVDNGSTDGSASVAQAAGATVLVEPTPGYGAAVHAGLVASDADVICVVDADGSVDPAALPALVDAVVSGRADLALGRRRPVRRGVWPWHARLGNRLVLRRLSRLHGVTLHDLGPVRVARRQALLGLAVEDRRYGYPLETLVRAARAGWRIVEVDVAYGPRAAGTRSKVSGTWRGSWTAARDFRAVLATVRR